MSINMCGRVNKNCINEKLLEKVMVEFFSPKSALSKQICNNCVTYEGITDENKVIISFVSKKSPPYNIYDSNIVNGEYEFTQLLLFEINKQDAIIDTYKNIIEFRIYLRTKIQSDILITSEVHDDICLLKKQEIIWAQNCPFN